MSGNPQALRDMMANLCHGGRMALLGIPEGEVSLDLSKLIFNMLVMKGIYGREMYETWYLVTMMLQSGLDVSPVITHRFPAKDHEAAFAVAASGEAGKVILDWEYL
jgi:threonine 3-dehydrogenase